MCGIVGIINFSKAKVNPVVLEKMTETLSSRGPDDTGYWLNDFVGFGHKRLSVLDISYAGHQPFIDEVSGCAIVYNGEIYNYRELRRELENLGHTFKSNADTEVLLQAYICWGIDCLNRFNGMFSFAIWDNRRKMVFAARDRLGIKPFYYMADAKQFVFASRPKALMQHPAFSCHIDRDALSLYLDVGFVPGPWSLIDGVKKLEPGYYLIIDTNGKVEKKCYWSLVEQWQKPVLGDSLCKSSGMLSDLVTDSVGLQMVSDVPLGIFLSGGVDSSVVLAAASEHVDMSGMKTFCVNFDIEDSLDVKYARRLAEYLGCEHLECNFRPDDLLKKVESLPEVYDEPIADISLLPSLALCEFARQHVTVCLSGDGGDELFGGYPNYRRLLWIERVYKVPGLSVLMSRILKMRGTHTGLLAAAALSYGEIMQVAAFMRMSRKDNIKPVFQKDRDRIGFGVLAKELGSGLAGADCLRQACCLDAMYFMADDNLQKMDVASMAYGLEVRVPLLDHRIVEFAARLPISHRINFGKQKYVLKKAFEGKMPSGYFNRPKTGFAPPIGRWLRNELKEWVCDELSEKRLAETGIFDTVVVKAILEMHMSGTRDFSSYIWLIVSLVRWQKYYKIA